MAAVEAKARAFSALQKARKGDEPGTIAPRILVLVGIPGSGKSTFCKHLSEVGWKRVSQDELGSRSKCESKVVEHLCKGMNVVVDRCNFDKSQRKTWLDLAKWRGSECGVLVFAISLDECMKRVSSRTQHPTLQGEDGEKVVKGMADRFMFPDRAEGFAFCRVIRSEEEGDKVLNEILSNP